MPELEKADMLSVLLLGRGRQLERRFSLVLRGESMVPFFTEGQTVTVDCALEGSIGVGEVIVFEQAGKLCAHRVLARRLRDGEICYVEKGDNQLGRTIVRHDEVLGNVVAIDGRPLPLSTGVAACAARRFYARTAYALTSVPGLLNFAPLRPIMRKLPSIEAGTRRLCLRASRGLLKLLMFVFETPDSVKI